MSSGRSFGAAMTARHWAVAAAAWVAVVAVLLAVADGQTPVVGSAAAMGVVLLTANARLVARRRPAPFIEGASARAETLLGASLVGVATASAFDDLAAFVVCLIVAAMSAVWVGTSIRKSKSRGQGVRGQRDATQPPMGL